MPEKRKVIRVGVPYYGSEKIELYHGDWVMGADGMGPEALGANPNCEKCSGHGILDAGHYAPAWVNCDACFPKT